MTSKWQGDWHDAMRWFISPVSGLKNRKAKKVHLDPRTCTWLAHLSTELGVEQSAIVEVAIAVFATRYAQYAKDPDGVDPGAWFMNKTRTKREWVAFRKEVGDHDEAETREG
jgi:hypothetical protein